MNAPRPQRRRMPERLPLLCLLMGTVAPWVFYTSYVFFNQDRCTISMHTRRQVDSSHVDAYRGAQEAHAPPGLPLPPGVAAGTPLHTALKTARRVLITSHVDMRRYTPEFCAAVMATFRKRVGWPLEPGSYEPPPGGLRLVVVGPGGGGMTFTIGTMHNNMWPYGWSANIAVQGLYNGTKPPLEALWKHHVAAPHDTDLLACYGATRIIYLFNDPVLALASMVRRQLRSVRNATLQDQVKKAIKNLGVDAAELAGMHSWLALQPPCPVLYIDFGSLLRNHQLVADFLGVPVEAMAPFVLRPRLTADPRANLSAEYRDVSGAIYDQMLVFDLVIRLPINYVDLPQLAAGPLAPVREPLPQERQQRTDVGMRGATRGNATVTPAPRHPGRARAGTRARGRAGASPVRA
jgi:hypothetical protein